MAEILSPCGSMESLVAAIRSGCNAVYVGGKSFSARQNATNFSDQELLEATALCHLHGVKIYQAINTIITDDELDDCVKAVEYACKIGIDGLITQDLCLVDIVKNSCDNMPIHSSTQMTIHSVSGAMQAVELGFSRVVVSREVDKDNLKKLCALPVEIEAFVHGALCMSVSGQCYMSGIIGSRSANRGLCAQACRLPCSGIKGQERYDLSLKDMSYINKLKELDEMGVASLKIEGRMKRPEYVACATDACVKALDSQTVDMNSLESVFSRGGFTDGYYTHKHGAEMFGTRQKENVEATAKILPSLHELYRREIKCTDVTFDVQVKTDKPCVVTITDSEGNSAAVQGECPLIAKSRPCDKGFLEKQLSKLGDTIYSFKEVQCDIDDTLAVPAGVLNALRREACAKLDEVRTHANTHIVDFKLSDFDFPKQINDNVIKLRASVDKLSQIDAVADCNMIIIPLSLAESAMAKGYVGDKYALELPRFTFSEESIIAQLKKAKDLGYSRIYATNLAHILIAKHVGMKIHTGFGFNITNSSAIKVLSGMGATDLVASFELKASQISRLHSSIPVGVQGYGRLPLMLTVNCPIKQAVGCEKCEKTVYDRTKREFMVKCSKSQGYVEILNSEKLYIADKLDSFKGISFVRLDFHEETARQIEDVINAYKHAEGPIGKITRGLYFRGVL